MKTILFFVMCLAVLIYLLFTYWRKPSRRHGEVDAIVPAYNEEPCLERALKNLLENPYFGKVICVNDGSTDGTALVLQRVQELYPDRLIAINQANTGKGGALMHGLKYATAPQVFLTDADTFVPLDDSIGYMLAEIDRGADAVGGIPSSNLNNAGWLPRIRSTVKLPMIVVKRTFQQFLGGAPFIISGAAGMFKTELLRKHGFSDRTKVEDLDLTWTLVREGYKVRQANRCIVYPQECNSLREEWKRWRRWIVGYAVCMRLHWPLIFTRFGLFSMLPMVLLVIYGVFTYSVTWTVALMEIGPHGLAGAVFPVAWLAVVYVLGGISAIAHRNVWCFFLAPFAVFYVLLAYAIWIVYGFKGFFTGKEPVRDKPTRYDNVVEAA